MEDKRTWPYDSASVLILHRWPGRAFTARLVSRRNRFLAVCKSGRRTLTAHVPGRGRCLDLLVPGRKVALVQAVGPLRRTAHTALLAQSDSGVWVSLDPAGAPRLVAEALRRGLLPSLSGLQAVRREIAVGDSRIDLLLGPGEVLCEVKSVGAQRGGVALFPDAPTLRSGRHLAPLTRPAAPQPAQRSGPASRREEEK